MKEFGSVFHYSDKYISKHKNTFIKNKVLYACGRHVINDLIFHNKWKRIWMPEYFCYEVIEYIKTSGIEIVFYLDSPLENDNDSISKINFQDGDVLFRINYFGMRSFRDNSTIPVPVIEDHSHDLFGDWAENSNADWVVGSLRKTTPIAEGGVLWSPKKHTLPSPIETLSNNELARKRLIAMKLKGDYLKGTIADKNHCRELFIETENLFDKIPISQIDTVSLNFIEHFNFLKWRGIRTKNWMLLKDMKNDNFEVLNFEDKTAISPFSLVLIFNVSEYRDRFRSLLVEAGVYPAILWNIPDYQSENIVSLAQRMISIHCDARYNTNQIIELNETIGKVIDKC